jgi:hypothetical protein
MQHRNLGIVLLVLTDMVLFGIPEITIIGVQMLANPLFAAGVINGLGQLPATAISNVRMRLATSYPGDYSSAVRNCTTTIMPSQALPNSPFGVGNSASAGFTSRCFQALGLQE